MKHLGEHSTSGLFERDAMHVVRDGMRGSFQTPEQIWRVAEEMPPNRTSTNLSFIFII